MACLFGGLACSSQLCNKRCLDETAGVARGSGVCGATACSGRAANDSYYECPELEIVSCSWGRRATRSALQMRSDLTLEMRCSQEDAERVRVILEVMRNATPAENGWTDYLNEMIDDVSQLKCPRSV